MITEVQANEIEEVRDFLLENYFAESIYSDNLQHDPDASLEYINSWLGEVFYIARDGEKIVGVLAATIVTTYYKQPECQVIVFYIHPDARGTGLSREMVELLIKIAGINNVGAIYTTSASGIGEKNNELYTNLFEKYGFQQLGTELVRFNNV